MMREWTIRVTVLAVGLTLGSTSFAQPHRHTGRVELSGARMLSSVRDNFGWGGGGALEYELRPIEHLGIGARYSVHLFNSENPLPGERRWGDVHQGALHVRGHFLGHHARLDPWVGGHIGLGVTGSDLRLAMGIGAGLEFRVHWAIAMGPFVRYHHVVDVDGSDANFLEFGWSIAFPGEREAVVELDGDSDGILDADDACPAEPEDMDNHGDGDGCPDPDNDGDSILDGDDQCPNEAETVNEFEDSDGCPDEAPPVESEPGPEAPPPPPEPELEPVAEIHFQLVTFRYNQATPTVSGNHAIAHAAEILSNHPEIRRIRIVGHADQRGSASHNAQLSRQRAEGVRAALIRAGIAAERLEPVARGAEEPVARGDDEQSYARNRRVEFVVVERAQ